MTEALDAASLAACALATVPAGLRWLRVAQREHYLAGRTSRFALRWWGASGLATAMGAVGGAGALAALLVPAAAFATAAVAIAGPPGLGVRGRTSPLRFTRRLGSLGIGVAVLCGGSAGVAAAAGGLAGAVAGTALALAALPALVDLALLALSPVEERLARRHVAAAARRLEQVAPAVVAVTGSYGKTSTKFYAAHLLSGRRSVVASPKSFNNRAGLTRTVNELLVPGTEVLVAEMGAYGPGEIAAMCRWLPPRIAVITAIGPVHLERFKSLERTLEAKSEITDRAELSVLNVDDTRLAALAARLAGAGRAVTRCSGRDPGADVAVIADGEAVTLFRAGREQGTAKLGRGAPPVPSNLACAAAVALALGCPPEEVLERMATLPTPPSRLEATRSANGTVVLDDTFNSNPAGARLALQLLAAAAPGGRRVVVTPGMVELGHLQAEENAAFARAAAATATDLVIVGRTNRAALRRGVAEARAGGAEVALHEAATRDRAVEWVRGAVGPGDAVLYENDLPDHYP